MLLFNRFRLSQKIGSGSFGQIFKATDVTTGKQVAVKVEPNRTKNKQLRWEAHVYDILGLGTSPVVSSSSSRSGRDPPEMYFPVIYQFGQSDDKDTVLVMELLGKNLDQLMQANGFFSANSIATVAKSVLNALEYMHNRGLVHRDLKPQNIVCGKPLRWQRQEHPRICIIDFGLAKSYVDTSTRKHIDYKDNKALMGTVRFCSINTHLGIEQSRRDDLESLGYILAYLVLGRLPWQGIVKTSNKPRRNYEIMMSKMSTSAEELCASMDEVVRDALVRYLNTVRSFMFHETPDYDHLRSLFSILENEAPPSS